MNLMAYCYSIRAYVHVLPSPPHPISHPNILLYLAVRLACVGVYGFVRNFIAISDGLVVWLVTIGYGCYFWKAVLGVGWELRNT